MFYMCVYVHLVYAFDLSSAEKQIRYKTQYKLSSCDLNGA